MRRNARMPGVIQLDTVLRVEAMNPDHVAHEFMANQQREFVASVRAELEAEDEAGRLRPGLDLDVVAHLITALVSGVQTAWLEDPELDMARQLEAFMDLLRPDGVTGSREPGSVSGTA